MITGIPRLASLARDDKGENGAPSACLYSIMNGQGKEIPLPQDIVGAFHETPLRIDWRVVTPSETPSTNQRGASRRERVLWKQQPASSTSGGTPADVIHDGFASRDPGIVGLSFPKGHPFLEKHEDLSYLPPSSPPFKGGTWGGIAFPPTPPSQINHDQEP